MLISVVFVLLEGDFVFLYRFINVFDFNNLSLNIVLFGRFWRLGWEGVLFLRKVGFFWGL